MGRDNSDFPPYVTVYKGKYVYKRLFKGEKIRSKGFNTKEDASNLGYIDWCDRVERLHFERPKNSDRM